MSTSPGGAYAASTHRSAQKSACASSADGARGVPNRSAARIRSRPAGSSPIPAAARRHIRHAASAASSHEASYDQTAASVAPPRAMAATAITIQASGWPIQ